MTSYDNPFKCVKIVNMPLLRRSMVVECPSTGSHLQCSIDWSARQFMIYYDDGSWDEKELAILVNMETFSTDYTSSRSVVDSYYGHTVHYDMDGTNGESYATLMRLRMPILV